jgi:hypothetical protein
LPAKTHLVTVTTAAFGFHFQIQCADALYAWLKNVVADFLSHPPPQQTGHVIGPAATTPVDLEVMAAEQNRCLET